MSFLFEDVVAFKIRSLSVDCDIKGLGRHMALYVRHLVVNAPFRPPDSNQNDFPDGQGTATRRPEYVLEPDTSGDI